MKCIHGIHIRRYCPMCAEDNPQTSESGSATGYMLENPLSGQKESIQATLRSLAGQENCDGEPYDQMMQAAEYIDKLEKLLKSVETTHPEVVENEWLRPKMNGYKMECCDCGLRHEFDFRVFKILKRNEDGSAEVTEVGEEYGVEMRARRIGW